MPEIEPIQISLSALPTASIGTRQIRQWRIGRRFTVADYVIVDDVPYICAQAHEATGNDRPGSAGAGAKWTAALQPNTHYYITDPDTGITSHYLTDASAVAYAVDRPDNRVSVVGALTLSAAHNGALLVIDMAAPANITVPEGLPENFSLRWVDIGSNAATFVEGGEASVTAIAGVDLVPDGAGAVGALDWIAADTFILSGNLAASA